MCACEEWAFPLFQSVIGGGLGVSGLSRNREEPEIDVPARYAGSRDGAPTAIGARKPNPAIAHWRGRPRPGPQPPDAIAEKHSVILFLNSEFVFDVNCDWLIASCLAPVTRLKSTTEVVKYTRPAKRNAPVHVRVLLPPYMPPAPPPPPSELVQHA